jgi:type VI secretion system protein ImpL
VTIKYWVFILFLCLCLVWAVAAFNQSGTEILQFGLRWTIIVLAAALALILITRLFGLWRVWRAKAASRPVAPPKPAAAVHEDDAALAALIGDANAALAKSANYRDQSGKSPLSRLPLFLLIGPAGGGKTTTFLNSGIEPHLLAGETGGSTRLGNIWLGKDAIFAEISGRVFGADIARWSAFLRVLQGRPSLPLWRRLWQEPDRGLNLRGVIGFCEVKELTGAAGDPQRLERQCRNWQEHLAAIGEIFGADFPVYMVLTKGDTIPFFSDFFSRLPESELNQILGCTLPFRKAGATQPAEGFAESEAKRLAGAFRPLYHSLAERRITQLVHEPNPARKPGIYEFPRELKRIRSPLVQFLTDAFRPNPLRPAPLLRGFYLTAVQEVEVAVAKPLAGEGEMTDSNLDTTRLFKGDATQMFHTGEPDRAGSRRKGFRNRWLFASDLLHNVILVDRPVALGAKPQDTRLERYRQGVLAAVCGACLLLCCAFVTSWAGNRGLLNDVAEATRRADIHRHDAVASMTDLQALDSLRKQLVRLQEGESLSYRWGLYTGNAVLEDARRAYFARFQPVLLADLNEAMLAQLRSLTATPSPDDPDEPAFDFLKTHLMISAGSCKPDRDLASRTLKKASALMAPDASPAWHQFADWQIDFYTSELSRGNPCHLQEDSAAREHARQYLAGIKNTDRIYQRILAEAEKDVVKPKQLEDLAPNYNRVLNGDGAVAAAFTQAGWQFVQNASKKAGGTGGLEDSCVTGSNPNLVSALQAGSIEKSIQQRFVRDYIERWQKFVAGFSVIAYRSHEDAAQKLGILSDHKSPLLAIMALTADQTSYSVPVAKGVVAELEKKGKDLLGGGEKKVQQLTGVEQHTPTVLDITQAFQPVQYVVPPASERWVTEKNGAYVNALADLGNALRAMSRTSGDVPDPQAAQAAADKALQTVQQLQQGFNSEGVGGVDREVTRLLKEPIERAGQFLVAPSPDKKIVTELQRFCASARPVLAKYPFNASRPEGQPEATLKDLRDLFAPEEGAVWKFQKSALSELTILEGGVWKANPASQKLRPSLELLAFLTAAQQFRRAFFSDGNNPHLTYILRPRLAAGSNQLIQLAIDGQSHEFDAGHTLQHQFAWPAAAGAEGQAVGRSGTTGFTSGFSSHDGLWAVFRFFGDAEHRESGAPGIEWKETKGRTGRPQVLDPPVRLEFAGGGFPSGVDVFNPDFFKGFGCPAKAAQ